MEGIVRTSHMSCVYIVYILFPFYSLTFLHSWLRKIVQVYKINADFQMDICIAFKSSRKCYLFKLQMSLSLFILLFLKTKQEMLDAVMDMYTVLVMV